MADVTFVEQSYEILGWYGEDPYDFDESAVGHIATVARTCYQSKPKSSDSPYSDVRIDVHNESQERLVRALIRNGHHAMLEHSYLSVRFRTDRAIANEMVRHRHFSYAQLSTRYVNSTKHGFAFVLPPDLPDGQRELVAAACASAADAYESLISSGATPEMARAVLPLCTATEIVVSGNFRSWRDMFRLRIARNAHPQIRSLMTGLLAELKECIPIIFDDIEATDD